MFIDNLIEPERLWVIVLLVIWAALLFGGLALGHLNAARTHRMPTWMRMASSLVLVLMGWGGVWMARGTPLQDFALWMAVGMTLGCLGDFFMAGLIVRETAVLGGMASFGAGHIAYILGCLSLSRVIGGDPIGTHLVFVVVWLVIGFLGWFIVVFLRARRSVLHMAALPYSLLLSTTAGVATALAVSVSGLVPLAIGAALFLFSDLLLAAQLFRSLHFRQVGDVVWLVYGPGQMLIVLSVFIALGLLR
ncbi:MAG: lysoplasmalogenase [Anaerolineae bacterium]|nr:lysoplasmalogenase [Anaerolineae bacterium]